MKILTKISVFAVSLLLCVITNLQAQNVLQGTVIDERSGEPIPYVQIFVYCEKDVAATDANGKFSISISSDSCEVEFQSGLFNSIKRQIVFYHSQRNIQWNIEMSPTAEVLEQVIVTASKYETNPEKSTTSIAILTPKTAESRNIITADALVNTAPGVAVVDNEPQIRGGSGFSSGMGSRVMILLDDMPLLRPDAGRPLWNFIPMEDVEQIDILKGAASVVFGSSALTGAINVHTAYPRSKPKTKVMIYGGIYDDPNPKGVEAYQKSWNHHNPLKFGFSFLHSRIIRKNFDFVIGGEYMNDQGYIGPEEKISKTRNTDSSTVGKYEKRYRLNFATRYRFQKVKGLAISLNGNFMFSDNAQSFFWYDAGENRYRTYKGSLSQFNDFTFYVDPVITYTTQKNSSHSLRNRILYSNNEESSGAQSARSISVFDEYQYNKSFTKIGLKLVAGMMNSYVISYGRVFSGDLISTDAQRMTSDNFAFYAQLDKSFLKKKNLTWSLGGRWEFYSMMGGTENKPIFRTGLTYQFNKTKTALRTSFGQGYRYPTIGEKYIAISVGRYGFYPNPNLKSEKSWNLEVGVMQPFMVFDFRGMVDLALFTQRYDNYIEFAMGPWGDKSMGKLMDRMGFRYLNIGPARISGVDFSLMGEGKISRSLNYTLSASYTYSNPVTLDPNYVYFTDEGGDQHSFNTKTYDTSRRVLKYRIEHQVKFDLAFTWKKNLSIGLSAMYFSAMKNIDKFFFTYDIQNPKQSDIYIDNILKPLGDLPFSGFYYYYNDNLKGSLVFDARISYKFKDVTCSFIVKNFLNKSYTLRPMFVEPPRSFNLQILYSIN